jgi:hypothetical protein
MNTSQNEEWKGKIMRINLTQHTASPEQDCIEPSDKTAVQRLLTFETLPDRDDIKDRAVALAMIAETSGASEAMIGGAPYLMTCLEDQLSKRGIKPLYAFSTRESIEQHQPDGSIRKIAVFKHIGFVNGKADLDPLP